MAGAKVERGQRLLGDVERELAEFDQAVAGVLREQSALRRRRPFAAGDARVTTLFYQTAIIVYTDHRYDRQSRSSTVGWYS